MLEENGAEGQEGLAWVRKASTRRVLMKGEGNLSCSPPHFDRDG